MSCSRVRVGYLSHHAAPSLLDSRHLLAVEAPAEAGHGAEAVEPLSLLIRLWTGSGLRKLDINSGWRGSGGSGNAGLVAVQGVDVAGAGGRTSAVGGLVDVFAVHVDRVGDEGGAAMTTAGVALLKAEELQLGLDLVEKALTHGCGVVGFV